MAPTNKPRIKIRPGKLDIAMEILDLFLLIALISIPILSWKHLPNQIPSHFNASGIADAMSGRSSIITLPIFGLILSIVFSLAIRRPYLFNYPIPVTEANALRLYTLATKNLRWLKTIILGALFYLMTQTIHVSLGLSNGLGRFFVFAFVLGITGLSLGTLLYSSHPKNLKNNI